MEKNIKENHANQFLDALNDVFHLKKPDIAQYSPLTLAYIGDDVYDLIIRTIIVEEGNAPVNALNHKVTSLVNATFQAKLIHAILPRLTEIEKSIYLRGRNAKPSSMAKNSKPSDYRHATGFETLMGYLYLENNMERVLELVQAGLQECLDEQQKGTENGDKP